MPRQHAKILRSKKGEIESVAFSDALIPLSEVFKTIGAPIVCKLQTRASAELPTNQRRYEDGDFLLHPNGSVIEETAVVSLQSMVGPLAVLHAGSEVGGAILHSGVEVERGATIGRRSELREGVLVGEGVDITQNCYLGAGTKVGAGSTVESSHIGPNSFIGILSSIRSSRIDGAFTAGEGLGITKATIASSVTLGNKFTAGPNLRLMEGVTFKNHGLLGNDIRIAPGVRSGEFCAIENSVIIDTKVALGNYSELGERCRIDVGATLYDDAIIGAGSYIGPFMEVGSVVAPGSYIAFRKEPIPVWPLPRRTFEVDISKQK